MLTLAIVSAWLALLGAVLLLPAYVGSGDRTRWIAAFALSELAAVGTGSIVGAEHVPSDPGLVGASSAGVAGLLLARAVQSGIQYGKAGGPSYFDKFRVLPAPSEPRPAIATDGCQPHFVKGDDAKEASAAHGRLQYVMRVDVLGDTQLEVRARLKGPAWWGLGLKWLELPVSVKIVVGCERLEGQCRGFAQFDGPEASSKDQLGFGVVMETEKTGSTLILTVKTNMEYRARGAPSLGGNVGLASAGWQAFPSSDALSLGMGRFVWNCESQSEIQE